MRVLDKIREFYKRQKEYHLQKEKEWARRMAQGEQFIWHNIIFGAVCGAVVIMLIVTVFVQGLLAVQEAEYSKIPLKITGTNHVFALAPGEYVIHGITSIPGGEDMETFQESYLLSDKNGGILVSVTLPEGIEVPDEFYIVPASYTIEVRKDGRWKFKPTAYGAKLKKSMEDVRKIAKE